MHIQIARSVCGLASLIVHRSFDLRLSPIAGSVARVSSGSKWIKPPTREGRGLSGLPVSSGGRNLDRGDRQVDSLDLHAGT